MQTASPSAPKPATPLGRRVHAEILREITSDRYQSGQRLPTHREWARRLEVSTATVHRVMREMRKEGLVESEEGSYTFLRAPHRATPSPRLPRTVEVTLWPQGGSDVRKLRYAIARHRFQKQFGVRFPEVRVKERQISSSEESATVVLRAALSDPEPTVAHTRSTLLPLLAENGNAPRLRHVVALDGKRNLGETLDDYLGAMRPGLFSRENSWEDGVRLLPTSASQFFLLFHKGALEAAGVASDRLPSDWEGFADLLGRISARNGGAPALHFPDAGSVALFLAQLAVNNGVSFASSAPLWETPSARPSVDFLHRLLGAGGLARVHQGSFLPFVAELMEGRYPVVADVHSAGVVAFLGAGDQFVPALVPAGPAGRATSLRNVSGWFLNSNAAEEQQVASLAYALEWERWLHEGEGGSQMLRLGVWPSLFPLLRTGDRFALEALPREWRPVLEQAEAASVWVHELTHEFPAFLARGQSLSEDAMVHFLNLCRMQSFPNSMGAAQTATPARIHA